MPRVTMTHAEMMGKIALKRAGRLKTCPTSAKGILSRAWDGNSQKTAIKAMCLECVGFDRQAIADCEAWACPLWEKRPFRANSTHPKP